MDIFHMSDIIPLIGLPYPPAGRSSYTVDQLLQDSYDYKEQVIIRDIYKRIGNLPIKTKITACEMLQYLIDIIEKAHD